MFPLRYELNISTMLPNNDEEFIGHANIHIKFVQKCSNITLHARDLNITKASIEIAPPFQRFIVDLFITNSYQLNGTDFYVFELNVALPAMFEVFLKISYIGKYNPALTGVYRVSYTMNDQTR